MDERVLKFEYMVEDKDGQFHKRIFTMKEIETGHASDFVKSLSVKKVIRRQYTEMHHIDRDENIGDEIYEGDIIEITERHCPHEVTKKLVVVEYWKNHGGFQAVHRVKDYIPDIYDLFRVNGGKPMGNIFENPNLLEGGK